MQVLGTFITEWVRGRRRCERLVATAASSQRAAEQLARVAAHHALDGWLVNLENSLPGGLVPHVMHFLSHLRACMKALRGDQGLVIW